MALISRHRRAIDPALQQLQNLALRLRFEPFSLGARLDNRGRFITDVDPSFPLSVELHGYEKGTHNPHPNWHESYEIVMPLDTQCSYRMGEQTIAAGPGDVLIINTAKPHLVVGFEGERAHVVVLRFSAGLVESAGTPSVDRLLLLPFRCQPEGRPHRLTADDPLAGPVHQSIADLFAAREEPVPVRAEAALKVTFIQLLHHLSRRFWSPELEEDSQRQALQFGRLDRVLSFLRQHYGEKVTCGRAAKMASMGGSAFNRLFKRATGMTFQIYLTQLRLVQAARLLAETENPIADIARLVGFADQSHLDRRFKKVYGTTPRSYRARCRGLKV